MDTNFRVYNSYSSSFFDLIEGNSETQQTKGLGLLLAKSRPALKAFMNIESIQNNIGDFEWSKVDKVIVNCELVSETEENFRADIVLQFFSENNPYKAIIIEAKRLDKNISARRAKKQLQNYIEKEAFEELREFNENDILGITLTKYPSAKEPENTISLTWSNLISKFYYADREDDDLLNDYFNFITNIRGTMKFYERDVYSIPTRKSSLTAIQRFHIYESPTTSNYKIKHKPLYLTFRKNGGGEMEKLYKIDNLIYLNFKQDLEAFKKDDNYSQDVRDRVSGYADFQLSEGEWEKLPDQESQIILLDKKDVIELEHRPRPPKNNAFRAYYNLSELLNNEVVKTI